MMGSGYPILGGVSGRASRIEEIPPFGANKMMA
jgi:hypothetical protein